MRTDPSPPVPPPRRARLPGRHDPRGHIVCDGLVRVYRTGGVEVAALRGLDLVIGEGELVAVVGPSGSGKSTLLNVLAGLDVPTAGVARVAGFDLPAMSDRDRLRYRREVVGFVRQQAGRNLLPYLTAKENVLLPMLVSGRRAAARVGGRRARVARAGELLELLGVADAAGRRPYELPGGERQRVAIAVALANRPEVLLADEPTGELDSEGSAQVVEALRGVNREFGVTAVIVTHDPAVAGRADRTVGIRDGRTGSETLRRETSAGRVIAEEYAVLDRAGRLRLPRDFMDAPGPRRRVRPEPERDHIGVWPDRAEEDRDE